MADQAAAEQWGAAAIIDACAHVISSLNAAGAHSIDLEAALQANQVAPGSEAACFIEQVVYGTYRYRRFLSAFLESFYHHSFGKVQRRDAVKYRLLTYLAAFRLAELTWPTFRLLVEAQEPVVVLVLLEYLFDRQQLVSVCRQDWLKHYDKQFVDDTIAGLLQHQGEAAALVAQLREAVYFRAQDSSSDGSGRSPSPQQRRRGTAVATAVQPFNLTQPRPKPLPQPPQPPQPVHRRRRPPRRRAGPTSDEAAIAAAKVANRAAIAARQADPKAGMFKLRVLERPMHADTIRAEAEAELAAELAVRPVARPAPPPPAAEVRLTAAAVLRESALYQRKQAEEAAALQAYEAGLRDAAAFDRWRAAMRDRDARQEAARIERLRAEMSAAAGAAAAAREELLAARAAAGSTEKEARAAREAERRELEQQEQQARAARAEEVAADRAKAKQAQELVLSQRQQTAQELREQLREDARRCAEQAAQEAAERRDTIAQLKGLERAARATSRTRGAGHAQGVPEASTYDAMSLEELRARLAAARQRQLEEDDRTRARILADRQAREAALTARVSELAAIRRLASAQASMRKAAAQVQRAQTAAAVLQRTETTALMLADRVGARHEAAAAEAARLAMDEQRTRQQLMQAAAGAAALEASRFRELREGRRRTCEQQQAAAAQQAQLDAGTAAREAAGRRRALASEQRKRASLRKAADARLSRAVHQAAAEAGAQLHNKQRAAAQQRQAEVRSKQQHAKDLESKQAGQEVIS